MDVLLYAAGIMAFAPTLLLMYAVLRKYTYPAVEQPFFSDPAFFGLFVVGLISGTFLFMFFTWLEGIQIMIRLILFAVLQCLVMVAVMNLRRFHGKSDSVFYGYGLGLGMGCTMAFGMIYWIGVMVIGMEEEAVDLSAFVWLFIMGLSFVLILAPVGTTIGEGVARLRPMEYAMQGMLAGGAFGLVLGVAISNSGDDLLFYVFLILALLVAAVYFYYVMCVKLSGVVKDVLRMEGRSRKDVPK